MSTRDYKQFAPGSYYHIFNRGNGKERIFRELSDYRFFISRLKENLFPLLPLEDRLQGGWVSTKTHTPYERKTLPDKAFSLLCYCLMPNHYHFLIKQNNETSIAKLISKVCTGYSKYFNKKYGRVGHVFQDKFKAVLVDDNEQLLWLSAYIHQNPQTAQLIREAEKYPWSSYHEYTKEKSDGFCNTALVLGQFKNSKDYLRFLKESGKVIAEKKALNKKLYLD